jgi:hypothetical protein
MLYYTLQAHLAGIPRALGTQHVWLGDAAVCAWVGLVSGLRVHNGDFCLLQVVWGLLRLWGKRQVQWSGHQPRIGQSRERACPLCRSRSPTIGA